MWIGGLNVNNDLISRSALIKELKEWHNESKQREEANYELETFESSGIESAMLCVAVQMTGLFAMNVYFALTTLKSGAA